MFTVGQKVICVDNDLITDELIVGDVYPIVDVFSNEAFTDFVVICNIKGESQCYLTKRFKLAEQLSQTKEQIIHGNNQNVNRLGLKGSTWILSKVEDSRYVGVQYSLCSSKDNYCRKTGVTVARQKPMQMVLKTQLPDFVLNLTKKEQCVYANISELYQAVVRLD
jgi:hypothetical protein